MLLAHVMPVLLQRPLCASPAVALQRTSRASARGGASSKLRSNAYCGGGGGRSRERGHRPHEDGAIACELGPGGGRFEVRARHLRARSGVRWYVGLGWRSGDGRSGVGSRVAATSAGRDTAFCCSFVQTWQRFHVYIRRGHLQTQRRVALLYCSLKGQSICLLAHPGPPEYLIC